MEKASEDRVLFSIIFVLGALILLGAYDVLYYAVVSSAQAAPAPLVWWLVSWVVRLTALTGCGVLLQRAAAPGRSAFFLILLGIGLLYAIVSSMVESSLFLEKSRAAMEAAFSQYADQLKAAGSSLTVDNLLPIARAAGMIIKMLGLSIAATISFFVSLAISRRIAPAQAGTATGASVAAVSAPPAGAPSASAGSAAASAATAPADSASGSAGAPGTPAAPESPAGPASGNQEPPAK